MATMKPYLISECNDFSNSESPCCPDALHLVLAIRLPILVQMLFHEFRKYIAAYCISERNDYSNSITPCRSNASHQVSAQSDLPSRSRCVFFFFFCFFVFLFFRSPPWPPSWILVLIDFSDSEFP